MEYKVLKNFKCRHHDFQIFKTDDNYDSVDEQHTEKLIQLGFIEPVKAKRTAKKAEQEAGEDK